MMRISRATEPYRLAIRASAMLLWARVHNRADASRTSIMVRTPGVRWADRLAAFCPTLAVPRVTVP
jgi:hypothetical protein